MMGTQMMKEGRCNGVACTVITSFGPIPMILNCPSCGGRHVDDGEFAKKEHHTHACQHCGMMWQPAVVPTCGVQFLPGYKSSPSKGGEP